MRRAFDVAVAVAVLALSSPLLALAWIAIRLESRGGAIYRQRRVGLAGREFDVLKLRTMVDGAEKLGAGLAVDKGDARITRVGALLRRTSLDELPNLVNVLRGDMAIVGPRPTLPSQVAQYTERECGRLAVKPGITGWAQVNGRASLPWSARIELDLWYIEHRSWRLDLTILLRSARMVLGGDGLYKGETGAGEHHPRAAPQDLEVQAPRAVLDVPQVELDPRAPRQRRAAVDLRPTGDARADGEAAAFALGVLRDLRRQRRARADDRHLAAQHVDEVGQLVHRRPSQQRADARDARVALVDREARAELLRAVDHRAELQHVELAPVAADAALAVDRAALGLQADRDQRERDDR